MSEEKARQGISRRSFLKTTATLSAIGLSGGMLEACAGQSQQPDNEAEETFIPQVCYPGCNNDCALKIFQREGLGVRTEPFILEGEREGFNEMLGMCAKGWAALADVYNPARLMYPLRRIGERGNDEWERITWDEAIETIASEFSRLQKTYGANAVATISGFHEDIGPGPTATGALKDALGMPDFATGADYSFIYSIGNSGYSVQGPAEFVRYANNVVIWGCNPAVTLPPFFKFVLDAKEKGTKVTTIDPYFTMSAQHSDKFISIRVSTDGALAMGLMNEIISRGLYDEEFLLNKTNAPFLVKDSDGTFLRDESGQCMMWDAALAGAQVSEENEEDAQRSSESANAEGAAVGWYAAEQPVLRGSYVVNGEAVTTAFDLLAERCASWSIARTSEVTDVSPEDIEWLIDAFVDGPTWLTSSSGMLHNSNGYRTFLNYNALQMLTGNLGKPGAGLFPGNNPFMRASNGAGEPVDYDVLIDHSKSSLSKGNAGPSMPTSHLMSVLNTGKYNGQDMVVKGLFVTGGSLGSFPGRNQLLEAVENCEFVLTRDIYKRDTSAWSDILLPAVHHYEQENVYTKPTMSYYMYTGQVSAPIGESKTDWEICKLIADKMGFGEIYFDGDVHEAFKAAVNASDLAGEWNYDAMQQDPMYFYRDFNGEWHDSWILLAFPEMRAHIYNENLGTRFDYGQEVDFRKEALPWFEPAQETWNESVAEFDKNPLTEKYPLINLSQHYKFTRHNSSQYNPWLRELDEPHVRIHPSDAEARGIKQGDMVRMFNDRGTVTLKAYVDPGIRPGVTMSPYCWSGDRFADGHLQSLSSLEITDPITSNECFNVLVEIERA